VYLVMSLDTEAFEKNESIALMSSKIYGYV
jgi:hypothetical protein